MCARGVDEHGAPSVGRSESLLESFPQRYVMNRDQIAPSSPSPASARNSETSDARAAGLRVREDRARLEPSQGVGATGRLCVDGDVGVTCLFSTMWWYWACSGAHVANERAGKVM